MRAILSPRRLQLQLSPSRGIELAALHRFDGVEPELAAFTAGDDRVIAEYRDEAARAGIGWGAARLPFMIGDGSDDKFDREIDAALPLLTRLADAGVTTLTTWLRPGSDALPYAENERRHIRRMRLLAMQLDRLAMRVAVEYVGPLSFRVATAHPFVHSLTQARELISRAGAAPFGLLLDSFHWHAAGETTQELLQIQPDEVLCVDISDAPQGVARAGLRDKERSLPFRTAVIDAAGFMSSLGAIGFDGDLQAEPYGSEVVALDELRRIEAARSGISDAIQMSRSNRVQT